MDTFKELLSIFWEVELGTPGGKVNFFGWLFLAVAVWLKPTYNLIENLVLILAAIVAWVLRDQQAYKRLLRPPSTPLDQWTSTGLAACWLGMLMICFLGMSYTYQRFVTGT